MLITLLCRANVIHNAGRSQCQPGDRDPRPSQQQFPKGKKEKGEIPRHIHHGNCTNSSQTWGIVLVKPCKDSKLTIDSYGGSSKTMGRQTNHLPARTPFLHGCCDGGGGEGLFCPRAVICTRQTITFPIIGNRKAVITELSLSNKQRQEVSRDSL